MPFDHPASRMQAVHMPIIPHLAQLIRQHPGTYSLGQGIVYYGPPPESQARLADFFQDPNLHQYQAVQGMATLREALASKLVRENGIAIDDERQLVVTAGSNMAFSHVVFALTNPGDEIILPSPYYFNHEMAIRIAGARPVAVPVDDHYQLDLNSLAAAIGPRTRALVTVSPNNPSGVVYPKADLAAVNTLCRERGIYHISDEAYEYFVHGDAPHFSPGSLPSSEAHTVSLYSFSKAYGMASWRIGYMVIPVHLAEAVNKIQDTQLICPTVLAQYGALGAIEAGSAYVQSRLPQIRAARAEVAGSLASLGDRCFIPPSTGAFYFLLKLKSRLSAQELAESLIRKHGVATVPGSTFGLHEGAYLRVAYGALSVAETALAMNRLREGLQQLL